MLFVRKIKTGGPFKFLPPFLFAFILWFDPFNAQGEIQNQPFAVVELFTSQGCSSCPPADQLLREVTKLAQEQNQPIYTLSFHVDYWNRLGWKDPYSQNAFTERQWQYAKAFKSNTVYTPQMVINGRHEFSGGNAKKAEQFIDEELKRPADGVVSVSAEADSGMLRIKYQLASFPDSGTLLNFALVENGLSNFVPRGENARRTLSHDHVVRAFKTTAAELVQGEVTLSIPKNVELQNTFVITFVQHMKNMAILGAVMSKVSSH